MTPLAITAEPAPRNAGLQSYCVRRFGVQTTKMLLSIISAILAAGLLAGCAHIPGPETATTVSTPNPAPEVAKTHPEQKPARKPWLAFEHSLDLVPPPKPPGHAGESQNDTYSVTKTFSGKASYYGYEFAGQLTASGEIFDPDELTAAHRSLPFGTRVRVTNLQNGKHVIVRINDRGPYVSTRVIDLSRHAADMIGMIDSGVTRVRVQVLN